MKGKQEEEKDVCSPFAEQIESKFVTLTLYSFLVVITFSNGKKLCVVERFGFAGRPPVILPRFFG